MCTGPLADGVTQRIIRYISAVGVSSCAFLDLQRLLSPYIHPSSRSPAGVCAGGASPPVSADPSTLALLSSVGLVYPAVDTAIRPLPALALIPTFNIAMGETQREALYAHVRSLTGEGQRPPADVTATVGPLPAVEEELTPEQSAALTRVRDSFQLNITALQV